MKYAAENLKKEEKSLPRLGNKLAKSLRKLNSYSLR